MNIIDHLSIGIVDIVFGCGFYAGLMQTLGCECLVAADGFAA